MTQQPTTGELLEKARKLTLAAAQMLPSKFKTRTLEKAATYARLAAIQESRLKSQNAMSHQDLKPSQPRRRF